MFLNKDENIRNKKVLLYLGKFPGYGFDIDGGSILARQLVDTLKYRCALDIVFIRKNNEIFFDEHVNSVRYVDYKDPWNNRFIRRLKNLDTNREALCCYDKYDLLIAAHISKFFGFETYGDDFWDKTILFPMFCSKSYVRSGEDVPKIYTDCEQFVVSHVNKIITPSFDEKHDLISDYGCMPEKISVVFRGISPRIEYKCRSLSSKLLKIICIGTIKSQKNTKVALDLIEELDNRGVKCELNIVGTIQDRRYYNEFCDLVVKKNLSDKVKYHISISQERLAELISCMDVGVSMSKWETFGRGIFECASAGLPTFVFDSLVSVRNISGNNFGIFFASSICEMAERISAAVHNGGDLYFKMSRALSNLSSKFSYKVEQDQLAKTIFKL